MPYIETLELFYNFSTIECIIKTRKVIKQPLYQVIRMYKMYLHIYFISTSIEIVNRRNPGEVVSQKFHLTNFSDLTAVDSKIRSSLSDFPKLSFK